MRRWWLVVPAALAVCGATFAIARTTSGAGDQPVAVDQVPVAAVQAATVRTGALPDMPNLPATPKPKVKRTVAAAANPAAASTGSSAPAAAATAPVTSSSSTGSSTTKKTAPKKTSSSSSNDCFGPLC